MFLLFKGLLCFFEKWGHLLRIALLLQDTSVIPTKQQITQLFQGFSYPFVQFINIATIDRFNELKTSFISFIFGKLLYFFFQFHAVYPMSFFSFFFFLKIYFLD